MNSEFWFKSGSLKVLVHAAILVSVGPFISACAEKENGVQALKSMRRSLPDFILSDLSMPEMDGWQLINELKQNRDTFEIPVIALTAHAMPGDRERAITAGFVNHLTKPLDPDKFISQLLGLLVEIPQFVGRIA
jgi:CheY-like chemotaxis protein